MAKANTLKKVKKAASKQSSEHEQVSLTDVLHLAQNSVETLKDFLDQLDKAVGSDFHEIMDQISATRADILKLSVDKDGISSIPDAGDELKAVVKATEDATDRIMGAAETIMTADPSDSASYHKTVETNIVEIFEACSFQDLTGQRINRVMDTLEFVDCRIHKIAAFLGIEDGDTLNSDAVKAIEEKLNRKRDLILHGPQDEGEGVSQSEIDNLF